MSDRYNTYGQSSGGDFDEYDEYIRRSKASRRASAAGSGYQQPSSQRQQGGYRQAQTGQSQSAYTRARARTQQPAVRGDARAGESSRDRFVSQQQAQGQRGQTRRYSPEEYGAQTARNSRSPRTQQQTQGQRASVGRRQVTLDQSGRVPRKSQIDSSQYEREEESGGILERFQSGNYHARPGFEMPEVSMPGGNLPRIILAGAIVVLLLVFGIRLALNGSTASQLSDTQSAVAEQQATLDELQATNAELQESIDSHAATIEAYNALKS